MITHRAYNFLSIAGLLVALLLTITSDIASAQNATTTATSTTDSAEAATTTTATSSETLTPSSPNAGLTPNATSTALPTITNFDTSLLQNPLPGAVAATSSTALPLTTTLLSDAHPAPLVVEIDATGNTLIRGVVQTVTTNSLTVQSWGGTWTIRTGSNTSITPANSIAGDLSAIQIGDFVGATGVMALDQSMTVDASFVRDWTLSPMSAPLSTNINSARIFTAPTNPDATTSVENDASVAPTATNDGGISSENATGSPGSISESGRTLVGSVTSIYGPLYTGTIDSIRGDSFTILTEDGARYTVLVSDQTTLWNNARENIEFGVFQTGDTVRLNGTLEGDIITATVVRDTAR